MLPPNRQQLGLIKAGLFLLALIPLARLLWLGMHDDLGANPIEFIERSTGTWALVILLVTLSFTPLRLLTGTAWPVQLRRMAGLFMFFYACLHITTYVWLDHWFDWQEIAKDIIKHPYVLVGFAAFMLSIPLALTSSNAMIKRLRQRWKPLHRLVYLVAIFAVLHFWWLVKKDITEPMLYALVLSVLLAIRVAFTLRKRKGQLV
ncbi:sulfoxide reductase heme-binding subunit YedZ [Methylovorus menthalis]|uniref:sulfite oxidase heme-binding subunit YedZ n=1 Tax=Methylovorus menthalis TaxID=1002227 RepID=UPI001E426833|nr:protein-methionine-sulfoxide reductase heme-binding subunit MsrQ [Methylovorus menthalis]MCB4811802.1 sulfoxide reductase heme-binding subunit YedZ [Methylovorus menthalis]